MTIVVNPHNKNEEKELLAFLDRMKLDYTREEAVSLSEAQQQEVLERDRLYEEGKTEIYTLNQVISHFNIKEK